MCVIVVADQRRPLDEELEKMAASNADGAGIAWRENSVPTLDHADIVKWEKGLNLAQIKELNAEVPMPYVVHFRIASCGGKLPELTHPFPVERDVTTALSGQIKGCVLFHNGHWHPYRDKGLDAAIHSRIKVPDGPWSDTRTIAWLAHLRSHNVLEFIDEKMILFGPSKIEIFHPDGWFRVNDLLVSNRVWEHRFDNRSYMGGYGGDDAAEYGHLGSFAPKMCRMASCKEDAVGDGFYCALHQPPCRYIHCSKPRVPDSEFCVEHQPLCTEIGCVAPRVYGGKLCLKHIAASENSTLTADGKVVPFRPVQEPVGGVGPHPRTDLVPAVLTDPVMQERSRWARSINTKGLRTMNDTGLLS